MKKLLLLLVFSASFFASAQTINVVTLTARQTNATYHVYRAPSSIEFDYSSLGRVASSVSHTLSDGSATISGETYSIVGDGWDSFQSFASSIGDAGKWYNQYNREIEVSLSSFTNIDSRYIPFINDNNWNVASGSSDVYIAVIGDYRFVAAYQSRGFVLTYWRSGVFQGTVNSGGTYSSFDSADDVIAAACGFVIDCHATNQGWTGSSPSYRYSVCGNTYTITALSNGWISLGGDAVGVYRTPAEVSTAINASIPNISAYCELLGYDQGWEFNSDNSDRLTQTCGGVLYIAVFEEGAIDLYTTSISEENRVTGAIGLETDDVVDFMPSTCD